MLEILKIYIFLCIGFLNLQPLPPKLMRYVCWVSGEPAGNRMCISGSNPMHFPCIRENNFHRNEETSKQLRSAVPSQPEKQGENLPLDTWAPGKKGTMNFSSDPPESTGAVRFPAELWDVAQSKQKHLRRHICRRREWTESRVSNSVRKRVPAMYDCVPFQDFAGWSSVSFIP